MLTVNIHDNRHNVDIDIDNEAITLETFIIHKKDFFCIENNLQYILKSEDFLQVANNLIFPFAGKPNFSLEIIILPS